MLQDIIATPEFWLFFGVGFLAQLIDGALGMAYGVVSIAVLSVSGVAPVEASALVHAVEMFTAGAAGISHVAHKNVDWGLFARLAPAGVVGGLFGTFLLVSAPASIIQPLIAFYLICIGAILLRRAFRKVSGEVGMVRKHLAIPVGAVGGLLDAWGGGWGPVVTSTLISKGHRPRAVIGTTSFSEFFVTTAISAGFVAAIVGGAMPATFELYAIEIAGLVVGGLLAAPVAGFVAQRAPARYLSTAVGILVTVLAVWQLARLFL